MKININKSKKIILPIVEASFNLFESFIYAGLYLFVLLGAMSSLMMFIYFFPEKAAILVKPFLLVFKILWNFIKATFVITLLLIIAYTFILYLELLYKMRDRKKKKREERWDRDINDIVNRLNKKIGKKK